MATRSDLILQVLEDLLVTDAITPPTAEDSKAVDRRADTVTSLAKERGLCWWSEDEIPEAAMPYFVALVANESAPLFGKPKGDTQRHPAWKGLASINSTEERPVVRGVYF